MTRSYGLQWSAFHRFEQSVQHAHNVLTVTHNTRSHHTKTLTPTATACAPNVALFNGTSVQPLTRTESIYKLFRQQRKMLTKSFEMNYNSSTNSIYKLFRHQRKVLTKSSKINFKTTFTSCSESDNKEKC